MKNECYMIIRTEVKYYMGSGIHEWTEWNLCKTAFKIYEVIGSVLSLLFLNTFPHMYEVFPVKLVFFKYMLNISVQLFSTFGYVYFICLLLVK